MPAIAKRWCGREGNGPPAGAGRPTEKKKTPAFDGWGSFAITLEQCKPYVAAIPDGGLHKKRYIKGWKRRSSRERQRSDLQHRQIVHHFGNIRRLDVRGTAATKQLRPPACASTDRDHAVAKVRLEYHAAQERSREAAPERTRRSK